MISVTGLLQDQSFLDLLNITEDALPYTLFTCDDITGRRATGLVVASLNGRVEIPLLPHLRVFHQQRGIPYFCCCFSPLSGIADHIQALEGNANILLLHRDIPKVRKVRKQINKLADAPDAQRRDLGEVFIDNICLGNVRRSSTFSSFKTHTLPNGRITYFEQCPDLYHVKETLFSKGMQQLFTQGDNKAFYFWDDNVRTTVFAVIPKDNEIMSREFCQSTFNSWVTP